MLKQIPKFKSRLVVSIAGAATIFLVVLALIFDFSNDHADPHNLGQVSLGEGVYRENCAACHGGNLEGQPNWKIRKSDGRLPAPPHDKTGHTWHHTDEQLFRITKLGLRPPLAPEGYESDMPSFGDVLTDEEIWAVLAYVKSRWPSEILARQPSPDKGANQ